jgi:hypothetical protein
MLESPTFDPSREVVVFRGVAVLEDKDAGTWFDGFSKGVGDAFNVTPEGHVAQLVGAVAQHCDIRDPNPVERILTVEVEPDVISLDPLPINRETLQRFADMITARDDEIARLGQLLVEKTAA